MGMGLEDDARPPAATWDFGHVWKVHEKLSVSFSDGGCGCCSSGKEYRDVAEAIAAVEQHIRDREAEIAWWRAWLDRAKAAGEVVL